LELIHEAWEPLTSIEKSIETMRLIDELYEVAGKR